MLTPPAARASPLYLALPRPQFTATSSADFKRMTGRKMAGEHMVAARAAAAPHDSSRDVPVSALPPSLDWRTKGVVTKVKDQVSRRGRGGRVGGGRGPGRARAAR